MSENESESTIRNYSCFLIDISRKIFAYLFKDKRGRVLHTVGLVLVFLATVGGLVGTTVYLFNLQLDWDKYQVLSKIGTVG